MKLTKSALRQMIKEAVQEVPKVTQGMTTDSGMRQALRDKAARGERNPEVSPQENNIIQQVMDFLTKMAATPDVELGRHRPQISALLTRLQNMTGAEIGGAEEEASEEIQEL